MEEIEVKVLDINVGSLTEQLERIGAERVFGGDVKSVFFDYPDGRIEEDGLLRLRQQGGDAFITLKKNISRDRSKRMEETEFGVSDFTTARTFLLALGLEQIHESSKHRVIWVRGDTEYVIDTYPGIPPLLEVEAPTEETVETAIEELGYSMAETVPWGAKELFAHYDKPVE